MKEGNLVKFVGVANIYKGRIGVVCRLYNIHNLRKNNRPAPPDSALVYFAGLENAGRAAHPRDRFSHSPHKSGLHPMALDEIEVVSR